MARFAGGSSVSSRVSFRAIRREDRAGAERLRLPESPASKADRESSVIPTAKAGDIKRCGNVQHASLMLELMETIEEIENMRFAGVIRECGASIRDGRRRGLAVVK